MISILFPTRKRPESLRRTIVTARETAKHPIEICVYVDEDDNFSVPVLQELKVRYVVGPRIRQMTQYWNVCASFANGDILGQLNDDVIFRTHGWDEIVENFFAQAGDKLWVVHGDHLGTFDGRNFGPHPFIHRRWAEIVGYFLPPYFSSDYGDTWLNDLANALSRRKFLPFEIEHMHVAHGKAEMDETTRERLVRHKEDDPDSLYHQTIDQRVEDARKLGALMIPVRRPQVSRFFGLRSAGECPKCLSVATVYVAEGTACNACGYRYL